MGMIGIDNSMHEGLTGYWTIYENISFDVNLLFDLVFAS